MNSDSDRSDRMPLVTSETVENSEKLDDQNPPSVGQDDLDPEVVVVEASPTQFDATKLPKTVDASSFRAVVV